MPTQLPVPSKLALTALRGLVLGTSCTLALVVEDRRRRIKNAFQRKLNGERIKSCRQYRAGGAAVVLAMEEEALLEAGMLSSCSVQLRAPERAEAHDHRTLRHIRRREDGPSDHRDPGEVFALADPIDAQRQHDNGAAGMNSASGPQLSLTLPRPLIPPIHELIPRVPGACAAPALATSPIPRRAPTRVHDFPSPPEIVQMIHGACQGKDNKAIDDALHLVAQAYAAQSASTNSDPVWMEASALLCRTCQQLGRTRDAARLLGHVTARGPVEEDAYYDHQPMRIIKELLSQCTSQEPFSLSEKSAAKECLDTAVALFLAKFTQKPTRRDGELHKLGRQLLDKIFSLEIKHRVDEIYTRTYFLRKNDNHELTARFIKGLAAIREPKLAIRFFLTNYDKLSPPMDSVSEIGDVVVQCVEDAHHAKAQPVMRTLQSLSHGSMVFKTSWAIRLLRSYWLRKNKGFTEVERLFCALKESDTWRHIPHCDGVYRVMVEMALASGNHFQAEMYYDELCSFKASFASDILILGRFAIAKAKLGDWNGVRVDFENMKRDGSLPSRISLNEIFVPILKIFAENHTPGEIEGFLRFYIEDMGVPPIRYMVTLMAKHYATSHDVHSFIAWIRYCASAGFQVDHNFGKAIIMNCAISWKFSFENIRKVYVALKQMCPDYIDRNVERFMVDIAVRIGSNATQARVRRARARLRSIDSRADKFAERGKISPADEVLTSLRQAKANISPLAALKIYRRARRTGVVSPSLSREALHAAFAVDDGLAIRNIIEDAHGRGQDISQAIEQVTVRHLDELGRQTEKKYLVQAMNAAVARLDQGEIKLSSKILDRMARICQRAGHCHEALRFAARAAQLQGDSCYDVYSFETVVLAYTETLDAEGIRQVTAAALSRNYKVDVLCLRALRLARTKVRRTHRHRTAPKHLVYEILEILDGTIEEVVAAREQFFQVQGYIQRETLSLMRQAALDSGRLVKDPLEKLGDPNRAAQERLQRPDYGGADLDRLMGNGSGIEEEPEGHGLSAENPVENAGNGDIRVQAWSRSGRNQEDAFQDLDQLAQKNKQRTRPPAAAAAAAASL